MGFEFLDRTRKTTILTCLVLLPIFGLYLDWASAGGFAVGCAWSLINLHVLRLLIAGVVSDTRDKRRLTLIVLVKAPVLYAAGFLALQSGWFPVIAMLAGFLWPLFIITLKALGRMVLRIDSRAASPGNTR